MDQPYNLEMHPRSPSIQSQSEKSTFAHPMLSTQTVRIRVHDQAREDLENIDQTLKRGLEARQVGVHLTDCGKRTKFL